MKTRQGFISNSSSTSFTCMVCNRWYGDTSKEYPLVCSICGSVVCFHCTKETYDEKGLLLGCNHCDKSNT